MHPEIIGREAEMEILKRLLKSPQSELLAIYGRRRVGKTFLVRTYFEEHMVFSCSGQYNAKTREQLINFTEQLNFHFPQQRVNVAPSNWQEAFSRLRECLDNNVQPGKKVLFFDELPWLDSHRSGFLSSFGYFWNMYASLRNDLLVVICGSAASWIIDKVVNSKGGLHNRITQRIRLLPFTLRETEAYLTHRNVKFDRYQLLQLYMVIGGVPAYLNAVERGKSAAQNIEQICFSKDGALTNEFGNLYAALFNSPEKHIQVIQALAKKGKGLTRSELLQAGKFATGGGITSVLNELTESGFIDKIYPFEKKEKDSLYRLVDEFSLFYFKFIQHQKGNERSSWLSRQGTPLYAGWCGYAFENICFKHIGAIKNALQIGGVQTTESSWVKSGAHDKAGAQIDLLIDRADLCINVCEMKFSGQSFAIDKKYAAELQNKMAVFRQQSKTTKTLLFTMITTYGVDENAYKKDLVDKEVTMDALFG